MCSNRTVLHKTGSVQYGGVVKEISDWSRLPNKYIKICAIAATIYFSVFDGVWKTTRIFKYF